MLAKSVVLSNTQVLHVFSLSQGEYVLYRVEMFEI